MKIRDDDKDFYQRCVIAGLLVLSPEFVNLATGGASETAITASIKKYGIDPSVFKKLDGTLGFAKVEWELFNVVSGVMFDKLLSPYDPPNCPDDEHGRALIEAAIKLDQERMSAITKGRS